MRKSLFAAGCLAAFTAAVHLVGGGRDVLAPALRAAMEVPVKETLHACWHLVSADLVLGAGILLAASVRKSWRGAALAVAAHFVAYGLVFIGVALGLSGPRPLLQLPQWTLLLPVGLLGLWGLRPFARDARPA